MDETMKVQTVPDIPENTLIDEPEYILKKKFCFATIPAIFCAGMYALLFIYDLFMFVWQFRIIEDEGKKEVTEYIISNVLSELPTLILFAAMLFLCVLMFIKLTKPLLCVPFFVAAFANVITLINNFIKFKSQKEFEAAYHNEEDIERYMHYSYSDYMIVKWVWIAHIVICIGVFAFAAIYTMKAASKNKTTFAKMWYVPAAVYSAVPLSFVVYVAMKTAFLWVGLDELAMIVLNVSVELLSNLLLIYVPELIVILLFCKWISNPYKKVLKKVPEAEKIEEETNEETEEKTEVEEEKIPEPVAPAFIPPMPQMPVEPKPQPVVNPVAPPPVRQAAPPPMRPAPMQPPVMNRPPVNVPMPSNQAATLAQKNNIELIKQYKELLDMGAITQEEYDEKKKELLAKE